jgi:hypothetical protein
MKKLIVSLFLPLCLTLSSNGQTKKVLFLGNSFTSENNLPSMIASIAQSAGDTLLYDSRLVGGYSLLDHASDPISLGAIQADNWDYIILQEQSQRPAFVTPHSFQDGLFAVAALAEEHAPCAQLSTYMTWGYKNGDAVNCPSNPMVCTYEGMQGLIFNRYLELSRPIDAEVTAVGKVWEYIRTTLPSIELYQPDERHPSVIGTYLASVCFYTTLFRADPTLISENMGIDPGTASLIRSAAKSIIFDHFEDWYVGTYIPNSYFTYDMGPGEREIRIDNTSHSLRDSIVWDFGDGNFSNILRPTHTYATDGTYTITLTTFLCTAGKPLASTYTRDVTFCEHSPTIAPNLILCPGDTGTIWTEEADAYQWYDYNMDPIADAIYRTIDVPPGLYRVLATKDGCSEFSPSMLVDSWVSIDGDCDLSIDKINRPSTIKIYPNPARNQLYVQSTKRITQIWVTDVLGNTIRLHEITPSVYDIAHLRPGWYSVQMIVNHQHLVSEKFIKL